MPNIYFKWSLVEFFNFDVYLSLKVILILINSTDPDEHPKADEKLFETQIAATLKQALLQKAIKIKCMCTKKAILSSGMQLHAMSLGTIWSISFPFG